MSAQPFSPGRSGEGRRPAPDLRPEDVPAAPVSLRRIGRLFIPYRARLTLLLGLIFLAAGLGVLNPFLLRGVLDKAIPERDTQLLTELVLGMIALSVITSVIGVAQTWISNQVGQRVMHDLRAAVYAHLQRMSLAFFTRTRTGEVQSRIANDIGGVDSVVTSTATSIVQNVTTVAQSTSVVSEKVAGLANAAGEAGQSAHMVRDHAGELKHQADALRTQVDQFLTRIRAA